MLMKLKMNLCYSIKVFLLLKTVHLLSQLETAVEVDPKPNLCGGTSCP